MYVSPAVRSIRDHPTDGESVALLCRVDGDVDAVADRAAAVGATVRREREFDTLEVTIEQTAVGDLLGIEGLEAIETTDTITMGPDGAGEDVRPEES